MAPATCGAMVPGRVMELPYTATQTYTTVQALANESSVTHRSVTLVARDSQGRIYNATHFLPSPGQEEREPKVMVMMVIDPITETVSSWTTGQNDTTVRVDHVSGFAKEIHVAPNGTAVHVLDGRTVSGVYALGYGFASTISTGQLGNDQPISHTSEWWCSPELKVTVRSVEDDLLNGRRTMDLTHIDRGEPNPDLFRLPEGYTIRDSPPDSH